jgi:hypothetical protein
MGRPERERSLRVLIVVVLLIPVFLVATPPTTSFPSPPSSSVSTAKLDDELETIEEKQRRATTIRTKLGIVMILL